MSSFFNTSSNVNNLWILSIIFVLFVLFILSYVTTAYRINKRMMKNNTISILPYYYHHHDIESIDEPTAISELAPIHYDPAGAASFIVIVLLWYSLGMFCMLGLQIRARSETIEDCARRRAKLFIQNLRDQIQTTEILEELVDKQKRNKLWDIYLGKTDNKNNNDKLNRAEFLRIRNIKKQLSMINRNRIIMNDILLSPIVHHYIRRTSSDSQSVFTPNSSSIEKQLRIRRRPSLDQQIIEQWKVFVDQSKVNEQLPWTIRKILIRRYFRRYHKNSSKQFEEINTSSINDDLTSNNDQHLESIDNEQYHLLSSNKKLNKNSRHITRELNERLNPYITYFHLPINQTLKSNIPNLPLTTFRSDHHIISMNHDESQC